MECYQAASEGWLRASDCGYAMAFFLCNGGWHAWRGSSILYLPPCLKLGVAPRFAPLLSEQLWRLARHSMKPFCANVTACGCDARSASTAGIFAETTKIRKAWPAEPMLVCSIEVSVLSRAMLNKANAAKRMSCNAR
eukprot:1309657-Amphidinium_carterae.1